jgi:hypothetical protein
LKKCPICEAYHTERIIYETPEYFVIEAKTKKGHNQRYMFCSKAHVPHDPKNYEMMLKAVRSGIKFLFLKDFVVFNGIYASIKDHWHVILSDRMFQEETVDITKEPRIEVYLA